jgi:hypothetical protein
MSTSQQDQPQQQTTEQSLATLGIEGTPTGDALHDVASSYTLNDFLPVLLQLLTPRKALTTRPTFTPKTFMDSLQVYTDGSIFYLEIFMNGAWREFPAGTVVSQILAGDAILVSPIGGTGIVTISNGGVKTIVPGTNVSVSNDGNGHWTVNNTAPQNILTSIRSTSQTGNVNTDIVILHGLGVVPKLVEIQAYYGAGTPWIMSSTGAYDGSNQHCIAAWALTGTGGGSGINTDRVVHISALSSGTFTCVVGGMDATQFTLSPTVSGSPGLTDTVKILCKFFA